MASDTRKEMSAAVAASQELGPDYDEEVAAGLVERIGDEIDRRIDQRMGAKAAAPDKPPEGRRWRWRPVYTTVLFGGGSLAVGGLGTLGAIGVGEPTVAAVLWAVIALVNFVFTFARDLQR